MDSLHSDFRNLLLKIEHHHVFRKANQCANALDKLGSYPPPFFMGQVPFELKLIGNHDLVIIIHWIGNCCNMDETCCHGTLSFHRNKIGWLKLRHPFHVSCIKEHRKCKYVKYYSELLCRKLPFSTTFSYITKKAYNDVMWRKGKGGTNIENNVTGKSFPRITHNQILTP